MPVLGAVVSLKEVPNPNPVLDKLCVPMGPEDFAQRWGCQTGLMRRVPCSFPLSISVLLGVN